MILILWYMSLLRFYFPPQYPISVFISNSRLTMQDHVAAMCRSCFFQLRQLRTYPEFIDNRCGQDVGTGVCRRSSLTTATVYCNGVSGELLRRLQSVQNAAARFITGTRKYDHITPVLRSLTLVATATKDNFQDRYSDVPMFEWTGAFLSGSRLHRSFCDTRSETAAICHLRAAVHSKNKNSDFWTEVIQGLWSGNLERSFPLGWKISSLSFDSFRTTA